MDLSVCLYRAPRDGAPPARGHGGRASCRYIKCILIYIYICVTRFRIRSYYLCIVYASCCVRYIAMQTKQAARRLSVMDFIYLRYDSISPSRARAPRRYPLSVRKSISFTYNTVQFTISCVNCIARGLSLLPAASGAGLTSGDSGIGFLPRSLATEGRAALQRLHQAERKMTYHKNEQPPAD